MNLAPDSIAAFDPSLALHDEEELATRRRMPANETAWSKPHGAYLCRSNRTENRRDG